MSNRPNPSTASDPSEPEDVLSIGELENLLDGIVRSRASEPDKRNAVAKLLDKFAPCHGVGDEIAWP
jgi:hypothetical protein